MERYNSMVSDGSRASRSSAGGGWLAQFASWSARRKAALLTQLLEDDDQAYDVVHAMLAPDIEARVRSSMPPPLLVNPKPEDGLDEAQAELIRVQRALRRTEAKTESSSKELAAVEADLEDAKARLDEVREQIASAESQLEEDIEKLAETQARVEMATQELQELDALILASAVELEAADEAVDEAARSIAAAESMASTRRGKGKDKGKSKSKSKDKDKGKGKDKDQDRRDDENRARAEQEYALMLLQEEERRAAKARAKAKAKDKSKAKDKAKAKGKAKDVSMESFSLSLSSGGDGASNKTQSKSQEKRKGKRNLPKSPRNADSPRRPAGAVGFNMGVIVTRESTTRPGVVVNQVLPRSGLGAAGVVPGDRLVSVNGFSIMSKADLVVAAKNASRSGEPFPVTLVRTHDRMTVEVVPAGPRSSPKRPSQEPRPRISELLATSSREARPGLGIVIKESTSRGGLYVSQISPGSPYELAGGRRKDVIMAVGTRSVRTKQAVADALRHAGASVLTLRVKRGSEVKVLFPDLRTSDQILGLLGTGATRDELEDADDESPLTDEQIKEVEAHQRKLAFMRSWSKANGVVLSTAPAVGDSGVLVTRVVPGSVFDSAGVVADDRIVAVNDTPVTSDARVARAIDAARHEAPDLAIELVIRSHHSPEQHSVWLTQLPQPGSTAVRSGETSLDIDTTVLATGPTPRSRVERCAVCGTRATHDSPLSLCGGCQSVAYCSRDCQLTHWPEHKRECARMHVASTATAPVASPPTANESDQSDSVGAAVTESESDPVLANEPQPTPRRRRNHRRGGDTSGHRSSGRRNHRRREHRDAPSSHSAAAITASASATTNDSDRTLDDSRNTVVDVHADGEFSPASPTIAVTSLSHDTLNAGGSDGSNGSDDDDEYVVHTSASLPRQRSSTSRISDGEYAEY
ncbi:uncharacterized protein AMSG_03216 [Thecamonas trahens ATCC 50062]|uniref:Uncharacterized protein n=1 Tax=Thecamonas trahens ATCC 50062 TaxID=461836 RepID=A0A0L0D365_THETB|nr:hypothetical protein AMSG_03216 [Thecamonas trahens ATCC 50062]KNC46787.1 hypothetical protein AMSG_03216 [Thecamonas trahens ATCC 50062]|eukprot:XP_013760062.1 hypothetical protein AMSG_03216 [Thecamonas trahens ATCC 50062]